MHLCYHYLAHQFLTMSKQPNPFIRNSIAMTLLKKPRPSIKEQNVSSKLLQMCTQFSKFDVKHNLRLHYLSFKLWKPIQRSSRRAVNNKFLESNGTSFLTGSHLVSLNINYQCHKVMMVILDIIIFIVLISHLSMFGTTYDT